MGKTHEYFHHSGTLIVFWLRNDQEWNNLFQCRCTCAVCFLEGFLQGEASVYWNVSHFREATHLWPVEGGAIFKSRLFHSEKCPAASQVQTLLQTRHLLHLFPALSVLPSWFIFHWGSPVTSRASFDTGICLVYSLKEPLVASCRDRDCTVTKLQSQRHACTPWCEVATLLAWCVLCDWLGSRP